MEAIKESDEGVSISIYGRCIGCGICVPTCPEQAISMVPNPDKKAPPRTMTDMYNQVGEQRSKTKPAATNC
jgi:electron transport complex protein RnfB